MFGFIKTIFRGRAKLEKVIREKEEKIVALEKDKKITHDRYFNELQKNTDLEKQIKEQKDENIDLVKTIESFDYVTKKFFGVDF